MYVSVFIYVFKEKSDMVPEVLLLTYLTLPSPFFCLLGSPRGEPPPTGSCCRFVFGGPCLSHLGRWSSHLPSCSGHNLEVKVKL